MTNPKSRREGHTPRAPGMQMGPLSLGLHPEEEEDGGAKVTERVVQALQSGGGARS